MYSRETQRLIYWLLSDVANFDSGKEAGSKPSEFALFLAKKRIKKEYLKVVGYKPQGDPITEFNKLVEENVPNKETYEKIMFGFVKCVQDLMVKQEDFSLALKMMSQEKASKFLTFLIEFCIHYDIPLRKDIMELFSRSDQEKYVYICLKNKRCVICGESADLDHFDNVSKVGGYKHDTGLDLRMLPLCRKHHSEKHNIGRQDFTKKYHIEGIYLTEKQVEILRKVYPNHFKAFKKEE